MSVDRRQLPQVPLRIAVGVALMYHSALFLTAAGHANFVHMLTQVQLPAPGVMAWMVALLEFAGGLFLILGFATDIAAALLILEIGTRILVIWIRGQGFPTPLPGGQPLPGYELNLQYLAGMIALLIAGPGLYSFGRRSRQRAESVAAEENDPMPASKKLPPSKKGVR